jgi:hypothetical protein
LLHFWRSIHGIYKFVCHSEYQIIFFILLFLVADLLPDQPDLIDFAPREPQDEEADAMLEESPSGAWITYKSQT